MPTIKNPLTVIQQGGGAEYTFALDGEATLSSYVGIETNNPFQILPLLDGKRFLSITYGTSGGSMFAQAISQDLTSGELSYGTAVQIGSSPSVNIGVARVSSTEDIFCVYYLGQNNPYPRYAVVIKVMSNGTITAGTYIVVPTDNTSFGVAMRACSVVDGKVCLFFGNYGTTNEVVIADISGSSLMLGATLSIPNVINVGNLFRTDDDNLVLFDSGYRNVVKVLSVDGLLLTVVSGDVVSEKNYQGSEINILAGLGSSTPPIATKIGNHAYTAFNDGGQFGSTFTGSRVFLSFKEIIYNEDDKTAMFAGTTNTGIGCITGNTEGFGYSYPIAFDIDGKIPAFCGGTQSSNSYYMSLPLLLSVPKNNGQTVFKIFTPFQYLPLYAAFAANGYMYFIGRERNAMSVIKQKYQIK